ncbi:MAG: HAMP domain-containing histidine kinase [Hyphomicrobiaceae bacterium]|nr:HAMP domain-containing histidine kinase [Hyphomicrobiaceae bacterium]
MSITERNADRKPLPPDARDQLRELAHELRTPLGAVIAFAEMLQREAYGPLGHPKYREYADSITAGAAHALDVLAATLEDVEISTTSDLAGDKEIEPAAIAKACMELVTPMAQAAGVAVSLEAAESLPKLRIDATRLRQALVNLLVNAIKFTPVGGAVTVSVAASEAGSVTIAVADDGIGITPSLAQSLAQSQPDATGRPGVSASTSSADDASALGRGLGLTLVRRLAAACGGKFVLESTRGAGTTAMLHFPRDLIAQA